MAISNKTRHKIDLHKGTPTSPDDDNGQRASALGVVSTVDSRVQLSKAEQDLMQSRALTVEDDPWNQLPNERRTNLIKPTYDPVTLIGLVVQNNTLGQCVDAMEVNVDGTGYDIERKDGETPEDAEKDSSIKGIKDFFDEAFLHESFTSIRRKLRRDRVATGNAYLEVIRNQAGEITLVNVLDAKLVRLVKLDDPVVVEKTITRGGKEQTVKMLVRERRYAQLIGNKVRYFREFGSSREVNSETGEWLGPAQRKPAPMFKAPAKPAPGEAKPGEAPAGKPAPKFNATNDQDKAPTEPGAPPVQPTAPERAPEAAPTSPAPGTEDPNDPRKKKKPPFAKAADPVAPYSTGPKPEDDPTKRPDHEAKLVDPVVGSEVIHFMDVPDVTTPYGVPRWVNQIPSVLGSRKAEELNLEYFNHGGLPPVMIFLQGGQLAPASKTELNKYLSGEAKGKLRGVVAEVYSTGGDLTSNSSVKTSVERFGGDNLQDSMFEGYDERCSGRVRSAFRLPPLFTGDTQDYTFATAYASYVVAEAQVFKPERELFDERINNTIMAELAPDYMYRSLPLTVHDVAVQLQAMTLAKDVTDRETFVDELNEIAGLNLTFQDPLTDPMNPMAGLMGGGLPGQGDPFKKPGEEDPEAKGKPPFGQDPANAGKAPPFASKTKMPTPVGGPKIPSTKPKKALPAGFAKGARERIMKMGDESFLRLAEDWAAHLSGDRQFEAPTINFMKSVIDGFNPQVRKLFNAYVGMKLAPGATYDPDGVADLMACAGDCLHGDEP